VLYSVTSADNFRQVWLEVLNGAGVDVEVCHVDDEGTQVIKSEPKSKRSRSATLKADDEFPEFNDDEYNPGSGPFPDTPVPPRKRARR
jgi:hypothetical protein